MTEEEKALILELADVCLAFLKGDIAKLRGFNEPLANELSAKQKYIESLMRKIRNG